MTLDRRRFLTRSCVGLGALAVGPRWAAAGTFRGSVAPGSIFLSLQLAGGNDWANTLIPRSGAALAAYQAARRRIGIPPSQTLPINSEFGFHPSLPRMRSYLNEGKLAVIQAVGHPRHDMSHFEETDRLQYASPDLSKRTGWLGDTLDQLYGSNPNELHAVAVGPETPGSLFSNAVSATVLTDADTFAFPSDTIHPEDDALLRAGFELTLAPVGSWRNDFVANVGSIALRDSAVIQRAARDYLPAVTYPSDNQLADSLKLVAAVIDANLGAKIFQVMHHGDFDSHDTQVGIHARNLRELDQALDAFQRDIHAHGHGPKVATLIWTEFGRRLEDNASGGTDHGAAGGFFLLGDRVRGGLHGAPTSFTNLDENGNFRPGVDFRQVYASVLRDWIDADPNPIVGSFPPLPLF